MITKVKKAKLSFITVAPFLALSESNQKNDPCKPNHADWIIYILITYFNSKWLIFLSSESIIIAWFATGPLKTKNVVNNDRVWITVVIYCDDNF